VRVGVGGRHGADFPCVCGPSGLISAQSLLEFCLFLLAANL
jgi:hypothetical protein